MKKLLSMMATLSIVTGGTSESVVACNVANNATVKIKIDPIALNASVTISIKQYNTGLKVKQYLAGIYLKEINKTVAKATLADFAVAVIKNDSKTIQDNSVLNNITTPIKVQFKANDYSKVLTGQSALMTINVNNELHDISKDNLDIDYVDNVNEYTSGQQLYGYLVNQFLLYLKKNGLTSITTADLLCSSIVNKNLKVINDDTDIKGLSGSIKVTFVASLNASNNLIRGEDILELNLVTQDITEFAGTSLHFDNKSLAVTYNDLVQSATDNFTAVIKAKYDFLTDDDFSLGKIMHDNVEISAASKVYKYTGKLSVVILGHGKLINSLTVTVELAQQSKSIDENWKYDHANFDPIDDNSQKDAVNDFINQYSAQIIAAKSGVDKSDFALSADYVANGSQHESVQTGDAIKYSLVPSADAIAEGFLTGPGIIDQVVNISLSKVDLNGNQIDINFRGNPFTNNDWSAFCDSIKAEAAIEWTGNTKAASDLVMSLSDDAGNAIIKIAQIIAQKGKFIKADFKPIANSKIFSGDTGKIDLHILAGTIDGLSELFAGKAIDLLDVNQKNWQSDLQKDLSDEISASPDYANAVGFLDFDFSALSYGDLIKGNRISFKIALKPDCREWIGSPQNCQFTVALTARFAYSQNAYKIIGDSLQLNPQSIFIDQQDQNYEAPSFGANLNAALLHFNGGDGQVGFYLHDGNAIVSFNENTVAEYNRYYTNYFNHQGTATKPADQSFLYLVRPFSNKMNGYSLGQTIDNCRMAKIEWTFDQFIVTYDGDNVKLQLVQIDDLAIAGDAFDQLFAVN